MVVIHVPDEQEIRTFTRYDAPTVMFENMGHSISPVDIDIIIVELCVAEDT